MSHVTDDYLSRLDDMLGNSSKEDRLRKPGTHPLWKLIDAWGGQLHLKASQLTLWGVDR